MELPCTAVLGMKLAMEFGGLFGADVLTGYQAVTLDFGRGVLRLETAEA